MIYWRSGGEPSGLLSDSFVRSPWTNAINLAKSATSATRPPCTFRKPFRFPAPSLVDEFVCRVPALSTLSTPSTAPILHYLKTSFNCRYLASCRFGTRFAFPEECNRVTDAPESTRRLADHISPQPSSVPIQARQ